MRVLVTGGAGYIGASRICEGATVLEVIEAARRVTGRAAKARRTLGWHPAHTGIESIARDAWAFERLFRSSA